MATVETVVKMIERLTVKYGVFGRIDLDDIDLYFTYIEGRNIEQDFAGLRFILTEFLEIDESERYKCLEMLEKSEIIAKYYSNTGLAYWLKLFLNAEMYLKMTNEELTKTIKGIHFEDEKREYDTSMLKSDESKSVDALEVINEPEGADKVKDVHIVNEHMSVAPAGVVKVEIEKQCSVETELTKADIIKNGLETVSDSMLELKEEITTQAQKLTDGIEKLNDLQTRQLEFVVEEQQEDIIEQYKDMFASVMLSTRNHLNKVGVRNTVDFVRNYRRVIEAMKQSNIIGLRGSTGTGKSFLSKCIAAGFVDELGEFHKSVADYFVEVNIDSAICDDDIFVERRLEDSTTVTCDTDIMKLLRVLEADWQERHDNWDYEETRKKGIIIISDPVCDDLDRVLSLVKAWANYEEAEHRIGDETFHILGDVTWFILYNDKGRGSIQLSSAMRRRMVEIQINPMTMPSKEEIEKNFSADVWDACFVDDSNKIVKLLESIARVNKNLTNDFSFNVGYISYAPIQYPKHVFDTFSALMNIVDSYKCMYYDVKQISGGTDSELDSALNAMSSVLRDLEKIVEVKFDAGRY